MKKPKSNYNKENSILIGDSYYVPICFELRDGVEDYTIVFRRLLVYELE